MQDKTEEQLTAIMTQISTLTNQVKGELDRKMDEKKKWEQSNMESLEAMSSMKQGESA